MFLEINKIQFPEDAFISTECKRITMLIFINKIMSRVYSLIFSTGLPRVLEEMKISLQPNPENMSLFPRVHQENNHLRNRTFCENAQRI
jgi:hypothetical protein